MKIAVVNKQGEKVKDLTLSPIFEAEASKESLSLYINYLRNAIRGAVANSKDRSEVSGGGKKPFKQKGTGRARQGSTRSPLWVGGGVTFGPSKNQTFAIKMNKSAKKGVILASIGGMLKDKKSVIIDDLSFAHPKTKDAVTTLNNVKAEGKISLVVSETDKNAFESFRNIAGVIIMTPGKINLIKLLSSDFLVASEATLTKIAEIYTAREAK